MDRPQEPNAMAGRAALSLADLERWEDHCATWRALEVADDHAIVELCTCYGEAIDVVRGEEPGLIAFIRARRAHPDPGPG